MDVRAGSSRGARQSRQKQVISKQLHMLPTVHPVLLVRQLSVFSLLHNQHTTFTACFTQTALSHAKPYAIHFQVGEDPSERRFKSDIHTSMYCTVLVQ